MIDYWNKLKLDECWSKKQRFNKIMNYILNNEPSTQTTEPPTVEEEVQTSELKVTVKDELGNPVNQVNVTIRGNDNEYTGTTGTAGGCTLKNVLFGNYEIIALAEGYDDYEDTISVSTSEINIDITLVELQQGPVATGGEMIEDEGEF